MAKRKVSLLPGNECLHFERGRCLYEETLNPCFHVGWRCRVIRRLEDEYDHFLKQMDSFQMDEEKAFEIWEKRLAKLMHSEAICADFQPGGERELPGCGHAHWDVCILDLPVCAGKCRLFRPAGSGRQGPGHAPGHAPDRLEDHDVPGCSPNAEDHDRPKGDE